MLLLLAWSLVETHSFTANKETTPAAMEERLKREETTLFSPHIGATHTQTTPLNTGEVGNYSETPDSNWRYGAG